MAQFGYPYGINNTRKKEFQLKILKRFLNFY